MQGRGEGSFSFSFLVDHTGVLTGKGGLIVNILVPLCINRFKIVSPTQQLDEENPRGHEEGLREGQSKSV